MIRDRFTRGLIAGFLAWIPTWVFNWSSFQLKISDLMFLDFAGVLIYGTRVEGALERYFALLVTILFMSFLGAIFPVFLKAVGSENYVLKGMVYSCGIWFFSYAVTLLFKVSELDPMNVMTAISNFLGSAVYGVVLAYITVRWVIKEQA